MEQMHELQTVQALQRIADALESIQGELQMLNSNR